MSKSSNLSGKTLVVDRVIEVANPSASMSNSELVVASLQMNESQNAFARDYSLLIEGEPTLSAFEDSVLSAKVLYKGTPISLTDPNSRNSSITIDFGRRHETLDYLVDGNAFFISSSDISAFPSTLKVIWTSDSVNAVPIVANVSITAKEITQYTYSRIDSDRTLDLDSSIEWYNSKDEALEHVESVDIQYMWMRVSSTYSFEQSKYYNFKYYKISLWYEGLDADATVSDVISNVSPKRIVRFTYSSSNFITNRRRSDNNEPITFSFVTEGYSNVHVSEPWSISGFDIDEEDALSDNVSIEVPFNNDIRSIVVSVTVNCDGKDFPWIFTLTPIDKTGSWAFLGKFESDPIDEYFVITGGASVNNLVIEGDTYLKSTVEGDVETSIPMVFNSGHFRPLSETSSMEGYDERVLSMASAVFGYKDGLNHVTTTDYDFFKNVVADHLTADMIGAKKIHVLENGCMYAGCYDESGNKIDNGSLGFFLSSDGTLKCYSGKFDDIEILGNSKFKGTIESSVLDTNLNDDTKSFVFEASNSNKNPNSCLWSELNEYMLGRFPKLLNRVSYDCDITRANETRINYVANYESDPIDYSFSRPLRYNSDSIIEFDGGTTKEVRRFHVSGITHANSNFIWDWQTPYVKVHVGNRVYTLVDERQGNYGMNGYLKPQRAEFSESFDVYPNERFYVEIGASKYTLNAVDGSITYTYVYTIHKKGLNFFRNGDLTNYTAEQVFDNSGICYSLPNYTVRGTRLLPESFSISDKSSYPDPIHPLYPFSWNEGDNRPDNAGTSSQFYSNPSISYVDAYGKQNPISDIRYIDWSETYLKVNGDTVLSSSSSVRSFSVYIELADKKTGVYLANTYAKTETPCIGTSNNPFGDVYAEHFYGSIQDGSKRILKENIFPFGRNALEIIRGTEIVTFNYKRDKDKIKHVGFIADDTDSVIAGENHDCFDYMNCIGVLMKAVQELSSKVEELENELIEYKR